MNTASSVAAESATTVPTPRKKPARLLYAAFASLIVVLTFLGFQQFYLHGRAYPGHEIAPPIKALVVAHGATMTAWIALFLVQPLLIVTGNRKMHMRLGVAGAVLAAAIIAIGLCVPVAAARFEPDIAIWGLHRTNFMAVPMLGVLAFGGYVGIAVWQRRRAEIHRSMMLMGTLGVLAAAMDRINGMPDLYATTFWGSWFGPFGGPLLVGVLFLVVKTALTRTIDRWLAGGLLSLVLVTALIWRIAATSTWEHFASSLVR